MRLYFTALVSATLLLLTIKLPAEQIVKTADGRSIVLFDDHTWAESTATGSDQPDLVTKYKSQLRKGIPASTDEVRVACEMLSQGWTYHMPRPKSPQAGWGNGDRRTTWFNGWWFNAKTKLYSVQTPQKSEAGLYLGDNQNSSNTWRNGGSPPLPDVFMFLLSADGGPIPSR